jgi:hypothetical protein
MDQGVRQGVGVRLVAGVMDQGVRQGVGVPEIRVDGVGVKLGIP